MRCWCLCGRGRGTSRRPSVKRLPGHQTSSWSLRSNNRKMAIIIKRGLQPLKVILKLKCAFTQSKKFRHLRQDDKQFTHKMLPSRERATFLILFYFFTQPHVFAQCRGLSNKWVSRDAPSIWQWEWGRKGEERGKSNFRFVCRESENAQNMYWQSLHSLVTAPIAPQKFAGWAWTDHVPYLYFSA